MTLGRKSKRGKIALWLIGALLGALALTPASAPAAGDCEYCVDIPGGDGNGQDPTANASGGSGGGSDGAASGDTGTVTTPTTDAGTTVDGTGDSDASGGGAGGGKGGDGDDKALGGKGGDRNKDSLATTSEPLGGAQSSDSDGSGFPVILVAIAALAAAGVGFAAWRIRRGSDGVGHPAQPGHSA